MTKEQRALLKYVRREELRQEMQKKLTGTFWEKTLQLLDKMYYQLKRHISPPNEVFEYSYGYELGYNAGRQAVLRELQDKSLYNFKSQELRMGYHYARYVAEKVEVCR